MKLVALLLLTAGLSQARPPVRPPTPPPPPVVPAPARPTTPAPGSSRPADLVVGSAPPGGASTAVSDWESKTGISVSSELASGLADIVAGEIPRDRTWEQRFFAEAALARYYLFRLHAAAGYGDSLGIANDSDAVVEKSREEADLGERPFGELITTSEPGRAPVTIELQGKRRAASTETTFVLSPGTYTVLISPPGKPPCTRQVTIEAYKTYTIDCR